MSHILWAKLGDPTCAMVKTWYREYGHSILNGIPTEIGKLIPIKSYYWLGWPSSSMEKSTSSPPSFIATCVLSSPVDISNLNGVTSIEQLAHLLVPPWSSLPQSKLGHCKHIPDFDEDFVENSETCLHTYSSTPNHFSSSSYSPYQLF